MGIFENKDKTQEIEKEIEAISKYLKIQIVDRCEMRGIYPVFWKEAIPLDTCSSCGHKIKGE